MLNKDLYLFLDWLSDQPGYLTLADMASANAPGYTQERVEYLYKSGYLDRGYADYRINDNGLNLLANHVASRRQYRNLLIIDAVTAAIALAAFVRSFFA